MVKINQDKINKAIELYKKQREIGSDLRLFTKEFMEAAHIFNELSKEEKAEMMRKMGYNDTQIKEAMR